APTREWHSMAQTFKQPASSQFIHLYLGIVLSVGCSGEPEREEGSADEDLGIEESSADEDLGIEESSADESPVVETPDACATLPFRRQAEAMLRDALEAEDALSPVEVRYPYQGAPY